MNKYVEEYMYSDIPGKLEILQLLYKNATSEEKNIILRELVKLNKQSMDKTGLKLY